jgi:transcriptional regulator with XRE-family HTH domain
MTPAIGSRKISAVDAHVGMRLKLIRQLRDLSVEELAELTDIDAVELRRFESGVLRIGAHTLFVLASKLSMPVAWFFMGLRADQAAADGTLDAERSAEIVNYEEGLTLLNRCYELASPDKREVLIAVAQSLLGQQMRTVESRPGPPEKRNGSHGR